MRKKPPILKSRCKSLSITQPINRFETIDGIEHLNSSIRNVGIVLYDRFLRVFLKARDFTPSLIGSCVVFIERDVKNRIHLIAAVRVSFLVISVVAVGQCFN